MEQVTKDSQKGIFTEEQIKIIEILLGKESRSYELPLIKLSYTINGFAYALGLDKSEIYVEISCDDAISITNCHFANSDFITYLLRENFLKEIDEAYDSCLILYFDTDTPKHAGIVQSNRLGESDYVESKWGTFQKLFIHEVWDVPRSYGNCIRYYALPNWQEIETYFIKFCGL